MIFTINIYCSPETITAKKAYEFANAVLEQKHSIFRLFFFQDGVLNSIGQKTPNLDDTLTLQYLWQRLIQDRNLDAVVCAASAEKHNVGANNKQPLPGFEISGLGQLIDGIDKSDRVITFG